MGDEQGRVRCWATTALVILTALNFVNFVDRSVLLAVQPLCRSALSSTIRQNWPILCAGVGRIARRNPRSSDNSLGVARRHGQSARAKIVAIVGSTRYILDSWLVLSSSEVVLGRNTLQSSGDQPSCASVRWI